MAGTSTAASSPPTWPSCPTCSSPAPPAPANPWPSTHDHGLSTAPPPPRSGSICAPSASNSACTRHSHLFTPSSPSPSWPSNALRNAVREMESPPQAAGLRSVRNIDQYNKLFEGACPRSLTTAKTRSPCPNRHHHRRARRPDDATTAPTSRNPSPRLAPDGPRRRHPSHPGHPAASVDVHYRLIKANVPTRISFACHQVDSRTIARHQPTGRGPPGPRRHATSCPPAPAAWSASTLLRQRKGDAGWSALRPRDRPSTSKASSESPRRPSQRRWLQPRPRRKHPSSRRRPPGLRIRQSSTSLIAAPSPHRLRRAAHLIDLMERDGLVGPADRLKAPRTPQSPRLAPRSHRTATSNSLSILPSALRPLPHPSASFCGKGRWSRSSSSETDADHWQQIADPAR